MKTLITLANVLLLIGVLLLALQLRTDDARGNEEFDENASHEFIRGDANDDNRINIADVVFGLAALFRGDENPPCLAAGDANDDARIDISDSVYLLNYLFRLGNPPPAPFPDPGEDPTPDLGCRGLSLNPLPAVGAYGGPDRRLTDEEALSWRRGRHAFDRPFGLNEGLGPLFNGDSCRGCHLDPVVGGAGGLDVDVVRFAHVDEVGTVTQLPTGPATSRNEIPGESHDELHIDTNVIETRQTPTILGLGLVDRLPDAVLLANADPNDDDGNGISGRPRMVEGRVARFGHKAGVPTLQDFAADAMLNELGITIDPTRSSFAGAADSDAAPDPELTDQEFTDLVFFLSHVAPAPRAIIEDPGAALRVEQGEQLFVSIGCADCHIVELVGDEGPIRAYSDFLLHDVADPARYHVTEGDIEPREFRTAPLWGLRDTAPYLHDGSAASVGDAITVGHHGEAEAARNAFQAMFLDDRSKVIEFLRSL